MRSRSTRDLALRALARFASAAGPHVSDFTVIGGLNADLLTAPQDPPHQGTVDVDVLIEVGLVYDRDDLDFGWLQHALTDAGFQADPVGRAWVWWLHVDDLPVRLDLLCDTPDNLGQEIALTGAPDVAAQNLAGPAPALTDVVERELPVDDDASGDAVHVRFAGLGGYVLAKAAAALGRQQPRDHYDLAYVLLYNTAGGPRAAARAAVATLPRPAYVDHLGLLRGALRVLADPDRDAARTFAQQRVRDGDTTDEDVLTQDAIGAALACLAELDHLARTQPATTSGTGRPPT